MCDDPEENIRRKIRSHFSDLADAKISKIKAIQVEFFRACASGEMTPTKSQVLNVFDDISRVIEITLLGSIPSIPPNGGIIISNHLGLNKLTKILPDDILNAASGEQAKEKIKRQKTHLVNNDPYLFLFAPVYQLILGASNGLAIEVIFVSIEFEGIHASILEKVGAIQVSRSASAQYGELLTNVRSRIHASQMDGRTPLIVIFPEGGTTGKQSGKGPMDLEVFRTGYAGLSGQFRMPVFPLIFFADQELRVQGRFLRPDQLNDATPEQHRNVMQMELKKLADVKGAIILCGLDRAGKSSVAYALERIGYRIFECGAVVKEYAKEEGNVHISEYYEENMSFLNKEIISQIELMQAQAPNKRIVIVGVRAWDLFEKIRERFVVEKLICVTADLQVRYQRHCIELGNDAKSIRDFMANDDQQNRWGLSKISALANVTLINNETKELLIKTLLEAL